MADFIEWQQFEELYLNIKDNDFFNTISLSRGVIIKSCGLAKIA